jgi:thioredoxin-dependent peroxiredoxin
VANELTVIDAEKRVAMKLRQGQKAPRFDVVDITGRRVSLDDYTSRKLLISFFRAAVCPLCNLRAWQLTARYDAYRDAGLACIAFFESEPERTQEYLDRIRPSFPIIGDRERRVYDLYGLEASLWGAVRARVLRGRQYREANASAFGVGLVENFTRMDGHFARMPADFLIGPDLRVEHAYYGRDAGDFLLFSEIDHFAGLR